MTTLVRARFSNFTRTAWFPRGHWDIAPECACEGIESETFH